MFINEIKRAVDVLNHTHTFFSPLIVSTKQEAHKTEKGICFLKTTYPRRFL
jgi:hypothetical protein